MVEANIPEKQRKVLWANPLSEKEANEQLGFPLQYTVKDILKLFAEPDAAVFTEDAKHALHYHLNRINIIDPIVTPMKLFKAVPETTHLPFEEFAEAYFKTEEHISIELMIDMGFVTREQLGLDKVQLPQKNKLHNFHTWDRLTKADATLLWNLANGKEYTLKEYVVASADGKTWQKGERLSVEEDRQQQREYERFNQIFKDDLKELKGMHSYSKESILEALKSQGQDAQPS